MTTTLMLIAYVLMALMAMRLVWPKVIALAEKDHGLGRPGSPHSVNDFLYTWTTFMIGAFWPIVLTGLVLNLTVVRGLRWMMQVGR